MGGQGNKRIALVTLQLNAYPETFIRAQIDLLPADMVLYGGLVPTMADGESILNKFQKKLHHYSKSFFKSPLFDPEKAVSNILKKKKIDIVLAQYGPGGASILRICKKAGIPLVVHFHGYDASHTATLRKYGALYKEMFAYVKAVIVVSSLMKNKLLELGCPAEKLILNPYGINNIFFESKPGFQSDVFFAMGRFVEKKAPELTIQAFAKVVERYPKAKLYMAGDGPLLQNCRELVTELGLEKSIFFPGILQPQMVVGFMQKALAFVQHSITAPSGDSEGSPVSIMEASAAGLPVISTLHAGIPEIILNGTTGILVQEKDIVNMAEAMVTLIENKELAKKMGEAGRERVRNNYHMDRYIATLREVMES